MKNRLAAAALASQQKDSSAAGGATNGADAKSKEAKEEECPFKPDISQMIPFKVRTKDKGNI